MPAPKQESMPGVQLLDCIPRPVQKVPSDDQVLLHRQTNTWSFWNGGGTVDADVAAADDDGVVVVVVAAGSKVYWASGHQ